MYRLHETSRCPSLPGTHPPLRTPRVLAETGGLLRLAVGLMQPFSEDRRCFTPLLNQLALYFQIRDDLINLASAEYMKAKSFCEDLTVRTWKRIGEMKCQVVIGRDWFGMLDGRVSFTLRLKRG